MAKKITNT